MVVVVDSESKKGYNSDLDKDTANGNYGGSHYDLHHHRRGDLNATNYDGGSELSQ
jgi:hypothetical protein